MASPEMAAAESQIAKNQMIPAEFGLASYPSYDDEKYMGPVLKAYNKNLQDNGVDPSKGDTEGLTAVVHERALGQAYTIIAESEKKLDGIDSKTAAAAALKSPDTHPFVVDWENVKSHAASQAASGHPETPEQLKADSARLKLDEDGIRKNITAGWQKEGILTDDPAAHAKLREVMDNARLDMRDDVKSMITHDPSATNASAQSVPNASGQSNDVHR